MSQSPTSTGPINPPPAPPLWPGWAAMHPPFVQHVERSTFQDRQVVGVWPDRIEDQRFAALSAVVVAAQRLFAKSPDSLDDLLAQAEQVIAWVNGGEA